MQECTIDLFGQEVPLAVTMWICDDDRYFELTNQRPKSVLWEAAALLWLCYCNACRYRRAKATIDISEFELWADEQYSSEEGKKNIVKVISQLTHEILKLRGPQDGGSPGNEEDGKKKLTGQVSASLHTAKGD